MMQEIEQKVASDLLDDIQYNLIHFVDCLREQKNEELARIQPQFFDCLIIYLYEKIHFYCHRNRPKSHSLRRVPYYISCKADFK